MSNFAPFSETGPGNINTMLKRLEAVTSRLEDIAGGYGGSLGAQTGRTSVSSTGTASAPAAPPPPAAPSQQEDLPKQVVAFSERVIDDTLEKYLNASKKVGGLVQTQAEAIKEMFAIHQDFITLAAHCVKPSSDEAMAELLKPTQTSMAKVCEIAEKNRASELFNHLCTISEGVPSMGWVMMPGKPGPFVKELQDSSQFYGNRVLKDYRDKDQKHVEWLRAWQALMESLRKYIVDFHTTGLVWNPKGVPTSEYKPTAAGGASATASGPPPPPPPPPPPTDLASYAFPAPPAPPPPPPGGAPASGAGMGAVFDQLNQGESVTKGLRKVDKSEMTHKNPELRANGTVPDKASKSPSIRPTKPPKPSSFQKKPPKPPKFELAGNKWFIENQEGNQDLKVENGEKDQTVNIFSCKSSTVQLKGKVNAVTIVGCQKLAIVLDSVVSSISITNSPSFQLQILGTAPTIMIDATDSGLVYLSKESLDAEIITAKVSAINVLVPQEEEGDFAEKPVPEQIKTVVRDGKLISTVVEHSG